MSIYYLSHFVQIRTLGVTLLCVSGFGPRWPQAVGWSCSHPQTRGCASKGAHLHGSQTDTHFCWKGSVVFMGHSSWILEYPCSRSVAQSCLTLCDPMDCRTPGFPVFHHLPEFAQTHVHWVNDVCRPLLLLPSIFPIISVFSSESALRIRWPKYWSFSFSISPSNEYSGMISFRMDCFDLLAVQGTLKSLLQHHSSKASVLQCSNFFWSNSLIHMWLLEKPWLWLYRPLWAK